MVSSNSKPILTLRVVCLLYVISTFNQNAEATLFDGCDNSYELKTGYSYLESPDFPASYPLGTSCRYTFVAPLDHDITFNCTINLNKGANGCSTEYFYISRDGNEYLQGADIFCGYKTFTYKSLFRKIVLAYVSGGSWGKFKCQLHVQRKPCDCGWSMITKIYNGQEASINEYPSMVALKDRASDKPIFCSAVIISHRYLLTAGHCMRFQPNANYIEARVGRHNIDSTYDTAYASKYYIKRIIVHPDYTANPVNNDIAILETTRDIEFSRGVGPICLPPAINAINDFTYDTVDVIGWGTKHFGQVPTSTLQKATLMVTDYEACKKAYNNTNTIFPTQICTYDYMGSHRDSCQFDSGGPVVYKRARQFLLGIISHGKECGVLKYSTGVNTRITSYLNWIHANTGYSTCNVNM